jgi:hypothetical protein
VPNSCQPRCTQARLALTLAATAFAWALLAQEIAEVVIEDEKQLDDSAENF